MVVLKIDGSYGEGGGQVIRTAVALAAITGRSLCVDKVRAGRTKPGLKAQHLMSVRAAAELCGAKVSGDSPGSMEFSFEPMHAIRPGSYRFEVGTAGSVILVAQTVLVPLALAQGASDVSITGGTHSNFSPSADYFEEVYLRALASAGLQTEFEIDRYGFVPGGQGEIVFSVHGGKGLHGLDLSKRGRLKNCGARVTVSKSLPEMVSQRGRREMIAQSSLTPDVILVDSVTPGAASHIACEFEAGFAGFVGLGEKGKPIERIISESSDGYRQLLKTQASVDEHLADQLVLPLVFAEGRSQWIAPVITEHLRTVIWVVGQFLERTISLETRDDGCGVVTVL